MNIDFTTVPGVIEGIQNLNTMTDFSLAQEQIDRSRRELKENTSQLDNYPDDQLVLLAFKHSVLVEYLNSIGFNSNHIELISSLLGEHLKLSELLLQFFEFKSKHQKVYNNNQAINEIEKMFGEEIGELIREKNMEVIVIKNAPQ